MQMYTESYVFTRNDDNSMNLQAIGDPTYENQMMDIPQRDVDNNYCELNMNAADGHTYSVTNWVFCAKTIPVSQNLKPIRVRIEHLDNWAFR